MQDSGTCQQEIAFTCSASRLLLGEKLWYSSLSEKQITSLGSETENACLCYG